MTLRRTVPEPSVSSTSAPQSKAAMAPPPAVGDAEAVEPSGLVTPRDAGGVAAPAMAALDWR